MTVEIILTFAGIVLIFIGIAGKKISIEAKDIKIAGKETLVAWQRIVLTIIGMVFILISLRPVQDYFLALTSSETQSPPTPTQSPPTPTLISSILVYFKDNFETDKNDWYIGDERDNASIDTYFSFEDGKYRMRYSSTANCVPSCGTSSRIPVKSIKNFTLRFSLMVDEYSGDFSKGGPALWVVVRQNNTEWYDLLLRNSAYKFDLVQEDERIPISSSDWKENNKLNIGPNNDNFFEISIIADESTFYFYVDDELIDTFNDPNNTLSGPGYIWIGANFWHTNQSITLVIEDLSLKEEN